MREVLFKTVHGSRLYGLANENSDNDFYTVVTKLNTKKRFNVQVPARYAKQKIVGNEDSMVLDFGTWIEMCKRGVPQALEAIFSTMPIEDSVPNIRACFRVGMPVYPRYVKTIKAFAMSDEAGIKKKRHALRLALNLNEMLRSGRFNPTLTDKQINFVNRACHRPGDKVYDLALRLAWS